MNLIAKKTGIAILIFGVAISLRFINLGENSFWVDELDHYYVGQSINTDGSFHLPSGFDYTRAKLYSYSTAISMRIFGNNEMGARFPAALFGVLSLVAFFLIVNRYFGFRLAALTLFLLSVLPFEIGFARISRFYSLLQLLTILCWYLFFLALRENRDSSFFTTTQWVRSVKEINRTAFGLFILVFLIALSVQVISVFLLLPFFVYFLILGVSYQLSPEKPPIYKNWYLVTIVVSLVFLTAMLFGSAKVREMLEYGISYQPFWASRGSASDRFLFLKMMMREDLFPLGALFLFGFILSILRGNKLVFFGGLVFLSQVFLFSFVFSYRMYQYIYNVFPFLVLGGAYFLDYFAFQEKNSAFFRSPKFSFLARKSFAWFFIVASIVVVSPFFTKGLVTPFICDGKSNGAVTFFEWKEAGNFLRDKIGDNDVVVGTVPLSTLYYFGKVDYILNMANYNLAVEEGLRDESGNAVDFYSGRPFIQSTIQLDSLRKMNKKGYFVADTYRLRQEQNVPSSLREWIEKNLSAVYMTKNKSVIIYGWENRTDNSEYHK